MKTIELKECDCGAIFSLAHEKCTYCGGSLRNFTELQGCPLEGNKEFRLNATLLRVLNQFVGKECIIKVKEVSHEVNNDQRNRNSS